MAGYSEIQRDTAAYCGISYIGIWRIFGARSLRASTPSLFVFPCSNRGSPCPHVPTGDPRPGDSHRSYHSQHCFERTSYRPGGGTLTHFGSACPTAHRGCALGGVVGLPHTREFGGPYIAHRRTAGVARGAGSACAELRLSGVGTRPQHARPRPPEELWEFWRAVICPSRHIGVAGIIVKR